MEALFRGTTIRVAVTSDCWCRLQGVVFSTFLFLGCNEQVQWTPVFQIAFLLTRNALGHAHSQLRSSPLVWAPWWALPLFKGVPHWVSVVYSAQCMMSSPFKPRPLHLQWLGMLLPTSQDVNLVACFSIPVLVQHVTIGCHSSLPVHTALDLAVSGYLNHGVYSQDEEE